MLKEKYISEAQMKEEPKKKLVLKIKEGSITPEHFNKRLVDEYLISVVDSVEDTGMLPEDKAKLDALPTAEELQQALDEKQNDLTFDSTPTVNSNNPVKSKGIKAELDKKQDKLTNGWVVQIKDEEAGSSGIIHKPKLINEDGNEVNVIVGATDRYSGWEQGGDTRIPTIGLVKEKLAAIDVSDQISGKANKSEMSVVAGTGANADKTTITLKNGTSATVLTQHQDVSEFIKEGEVFGTGDDSTASFNPYADTVWNKSQTLSESQRQQIRENIGVGAADNEDIQNVSGELKFADKAYNTSSHSGLGRKYLRKNIVSNKNVLTQAMVNTANTIYHIQYDYDLNGQTITLPTGCVLEFDGGSLKNGTLVGNGCYINTSPTKILDGVYISGISNDVIDVRWYGVLPNDNTQDVTTKLMPYVEGGNISLYFPKGTYYFSEYYFENTSNDKLSIIGEHKNIISFPVVFMPISSTQPYIMKFGGGKNEIGGNGRAYNIEIRNILFRTDAGHTATALTNSYGVTSDYDFAALMLDKVEIGTFTISGTGLHNMPLLMIGYSYECTFDNIVSYRNHGSSKLPIIVINNNENSSFSCINIRSLMVETFVGNIIYSCVGSDGRELTINNLNVEGTVQWEGETITFERNFYDVIDFSSYSHVPMFRIGGRVGFTINNMNIASVNQIWTNSLDNPVANMTRTLFLGTSFTSTIVIEELISIGTAKYQVYDGTSDQKYIGYLTINHTNCQIIPFRTATQGVSVLTKQNTFFDNNFIQLKYNYIYKGMELFDVVREFALTNYGHGRRFFNDTKNFYLYLGLYVNGYPLVSPNGLKLSALTNYLYLRGIKSGGSGGTDIVYTLQYYNASDVMIYSEDRTERTTANQESTFLINLAYGGDSCSYIKFLYKNTNGYGFKVTAFGLFDKWNLPILRIGDTISRPAKTYNGFEFADTSLNLPVYHFDRPAATASKQMQASNGYVFDTNFLSFGDRYKITVSSHLGYTVFIGLATDQSGSDETTLTLLTFPNSETTNQGELIVNIDTTNYPYMFVRCGRTTPVDVNFFLFESAWLNADGNLAEKNKGITSERPSTLTVNDNGFKYFDTTLNKTIWWDGSDWIDSDGANAGVVRSGTFANKPAAADIYVGFRYFCIDKQTTEGATDGIEIIYKGNDVWVDALGRVVS